MSAKEELEKQLAAYVGIVQGPVEIAQDAVNEAMIRHWCEAMGDRNPAYLDPEAAARSVHGGIVAPPVMLQAWILGGLEMADDAAGPKNKQQEVHRLLSHSESGMAAAELDRAACAAFPGLLTPSSRLVKACLLSYGQEVEAESGVWVLRPEDRAARVQDVEATRQMLAQLGTHLGFQVTGAVPLEWRSGGQPAYTFAVIASAALGQTLLNPALDPARSILVLPGGRASLAQYKLKQDPRLKAAVERGWRLVKFRLIRRLADDTTLTRENLDERLSLDPLWETEAQILLF